MLQLSVGERQCSEIEYARIEMFTVYHTAFNVYELWMLFNGIVFEMVSFIAFNILSTDKSIIKDYLYFPNRTINTYWCFLTKFWKMNFINQFSPTNILLNSYQNVISHCNNELWFAQMQSKSQIVIQHTNDTLAIILMKRMSEGVFAISLAFVLVICMDFECPYTAEHSKRPLNNKFTRRKCCVSNAPFLP